MKIVTGLLLCLGLIVCAALFSCGNSPFDSDTDLGSGIINDKNSIYNLANAKFCDDTIARREGWSFIDTRDSLRSGLHTKDALFYLDNTKNVRHYVYFGEWRNERAFSYFQFDAATLDAWLDMIAGNSSYQFASLSFCFENLSWLSHGPEMIYAEVGYYDAPVKPRNEKVTIGSLNELVHYGYAGGAAAQHTIPMDAGYILDTVPVSTVTSRRYTHGYLHVLELGYMPVDTIVLDTVNTLHPFKKDTVVLDTLYLTRPDTVYIIGVISFAYDTVRNVITYPRDTIVYDSMTPAPDLVKQGQRIASSYGDTLVGGDTTWTMATVLTRPETTTVYTVKTTINYIVTGQDTVKIIDYDTVRCIQTAFLDTVVQRSVTAPKKTLKLKASNPAWWEITGSDTAKNVCMYVRLDSSQGNAMQFIADASLKLKYLHLGTRDTVTKTLKPRYYDVSVFERDAGPLLDTTALSSSAAGRYAALTLDLKPLWENMKDSSGAIRYRNIPKADITVTADTAFFHRSAGSAVHLHYALSPKRLEDIEQIETFLKYESFTAATKTVTLRVNTFLVDMLYAQKTLPETGYLYIWTVPSFFAHVQWGAPDNGLPISYIVSDPK